MNRNLRKIAVNYLPTLAMILLLSLGLNLILTDVKISITYQEKSRAKNVNPIDNDRLPLRQLVKTFDTNHNGTLSPRYCPPNLIPIHDTYLPRTKTHDGRKIPRVVHMTSKSRCVTKRIAENINRWRFRGHSFYFHDDDAVNRLLYNPRYSRLFPQLRDTLKCVTNGATRSDLWRYLILWDYGGIYTDIDNTPTKMSVRTISHNDEAFLTIEKLGVPGQYLIATAKGHPLVALSLECALRLLRETGNVMINRSPKTTGPRALKNGFVEFQARAGYVTDGYVDAGVYYGAYYADDANNNSTTTTTKKKRWSVRVVGDKSESKKYVDRYGVSDKIGEYKVMNMSHFSEINYSRPGAVSCMDHLRRTNGTDKVANYQFNKEENRYVEVDEN